MLNRKYQVWWPIICLLVVASLVAGILKVFSSQHLLVTFLESGKPIPGLTVTVVVSASSELNGNAYSTNGSGQIIIPRPSKVGPSAVEMNRGNGETRNVDLVFPKSKWCVYNFEKDGTITKKYPDYASSYPPKDRL